MYRDELDVELVLPPPGAEAPIDRVLMRRVLVNLVDNALEAAGGRPVRLRLRGTHDPRTGRTQILVEDDGPGVSAELAARIFEPYFTTKTTGTGLGLAIVKKIVLQHGGAITLRASSLGGASFVIALPPVPAHLPALEEEDDEGPAASGAPRATEGDAEAAAPDPVPDG
jgi:signal transduction histidine kinase